MWVSSSPSSPTTRTSRPRPSSSPILTTPVRVASVALPFGVRASKSSTTRGRPPAISLPATPPVWKVLIVSCVPGSPIDWAAITPTASPTSIIWRVASEEPYAFAETPNSELSVNGESTCTRVTLGSSRKITSSSSPMSLPASITPSVSSTS